MYTLKPDEKTTPVMVYTRQSVVRGEVVTKQSVLRVNIWLRTEGAPKYLHILKPQVLVMGGGAVKPLCYSEIFYPTSEAIAFHTLPPCNEPFDYDPSETKRTMEPVELQVGTFLMKGRLRVSTQAEMTTTLDIARTSWMSVYEVSVSNLCLPQMPAIQVPMVLVSPNHVAFAMA